MSEFNEKPKKKFYKRWWFWLIVAVVVIGVGGAAGSGGDDPADTKTAQTEQTEEATEATEATEALTTGQRNALGSAESYLSTMPFLSLIHIYRLHFRPAAQTSSWRHVL